MYFEPFILAKQSQTQPKPRLISRRLTRLPVHRPRRTQTPRRSCGTPLRAVSAQKRRIDGVTVGTLFVPRVSAGPISANGSRLPMACGPDVALYAPGNAL